MQLNYKIIFFCTIFFIPIILLSQAKKISSIELKEFTSQKPYLEHFVVKNNQIYIGAYEMLYTLSMNGEIIDTLTPLIYNNHKSSEYTFDVFDNKKIDDSNKICFFNFLTDIIIYKNKIKLINLEGLPFNSLQNDYFVRAHTIFDGNKHFYSLYVSNKAAKDGKYYPVITKLDTITGIDMDDIVFNERKLNFKLNFLEETTFKMTDSLFVFANNITPYKNQIVFTDTTLTAKKVIDVKRTLDILPTEKCLTKVISLENDNCLFVVSLLDKKKDIIARGNYKNGVVTKLFTVSKPKPTYVLDRKNRVEFSALPYYKQSKYPNQILYAHNQDKIYSLYYENDGFIVDIYKLN